MKQVIAKDSPLTAAQVEELASGRCEPAFTYCNRRNTVVKVEVDGKPYVVKYFKTPNIINRLVYGTLRRSKARRAMEWSEELINNGFCCPKPIAYTEEKRSLLFGDSCFISEYYGHPTLKRFLVNEGNRWEGGATSTLSPDTRMRLMHDLAEFVLSLHTSGFLPGDMNWENIFVIEDAKGADRADRSDKSERSDSGNFTFALTDVNRTRLLTSGQMPGLKTSMKAFGQMVPDPELQAEIAPFYARLRGFDPAEALMASLEARVKRRKKRARIRRILHPFSKRK